MLEIGSLVDGKYKILNKIGQGGMSVVYLAMNEKANKQWAIKEIRKDGVSNYEVVKQGLIVETDLLKKLNHPNLPSIVDVIDRDDTFLIVMDYIEGNSLSKIVKHQGALPQEDVVEWAKQLCDVLGYLHSREPAIIYRDMKPANVMLKPDGNVTLIDFGTAREFKETSVADTTCLGTRGYAAPEQFGGQGQTDARTDIYCLGATLYHLLTGHNPAEPPYEMYPIRKWNPLLSSGLEQIIAKCTQQNPEDRYQSCAELMYDLQHYKELDIESQKQYRKSWRIFVGSCVMTVMCLVGAVGCYAGKKYNVSINYETYMEKANNISKYATDEGDFEEALDLYKNAIKSDPTKVEAYQEMVVLLNDNKIKDNLREDCLRNFFRSDSSYLNKLKKKSENDYAVIIYEIGVLYYRANMKSGAFFSKIGDLKLEGDEYESLKNKAESINKLLVEIDGNKEILKRLMNEKADYSKDKGALEELCENINKYRKELDVEIDISVNNHKIIDIRSSDKDALNDVIDKIKTISNRDEYQNNTIESVEEVLKEYSK